MYQLVFSDDILLLSLENFIPQYVRAKRRSRSFSRRSTLNQIYFAHEFSQVNHNMSDVLLDLQTAYNIVNRYILWYRLAASFGIPGPIIKLLKNLFDNNNLNKQSKSGNNNKLQKISMFGSSRTKSVDSFLLVVESKKDSTIHQVLAEDGCLLKKRLAARKETPVFAVLTNGTDFRFFAIDTDGVVYASDKEILKLEEEGTHKSSYSLSEILRWLTWFMTAIKSISPRASTEDLTVEEIEDSLTQLRN